MMKTAPRNLLLLVALVLITAKASADSFSRDIVRSMILEQIQTTGLPFEIPFEFFILDEAQVIEFTDSTLEQEICRAHVRLAGRCEPDDGLDQVSERFHMISTLEYAIFPDDIARYNVAFTQLVSETCHKVPTDDLKIADKSLTNHTDRNRSGAQLRDPFVLPKDAVDLAGKPLSGWRKPELIPGLADIRLRAVRNHPEDPVAVIEFHGYYGRGVCELQKNARFGWFDITGITDRKIVIDADSIDAYGRPLPRKLVQISRYRQAEKEGNAE